MVAGQAVEIASLSVRFMIFAFLDPGTETINFGTRSKVGS
jgi:hypothetical protein